MYAIQVHSLELEPQQGGTTLKHENIFLDISSEGERSRRYFLGTFPQPLKRGYESIITCVT